PGTEQLQTMVTALSDGGWAVTWRTTKMPVGAPDHLGLYQQRFNARGEPVGGETLVNTTTVGNQGSHDVIALPNGRWVVIWGSYDRPGLHQQVFAANGTKEGTEVYLSNTFPAYHSPWNVADAVLLEDGGWVVAWSEFDGPVGRVDSAGAFFLRF